MRCLYCGKELALLKRLTGGGDFCSDAHKQSYQEEYNRLALSRLLQAQKKGQQASNLPAQSPPATLASVAVEEPAAEPESEQVAIPEMESEERSTGEESQEIVPVVTEAGEEASFEVAEDREPEPQEPAGFLVEGPAVAVLEEQTPYQEAWLEQSPGPVVSEWHFTPEVDLDLSFADPLALDLALHSATVEDRTALPELAPQPWPDAQPASVPSGAVRDVVSRDKTVNTHPFPARGAIAIEIAPSAAEASPDVSFVEAVGFETSVVIENSELLELWFTPMDFPAEDSDVALEARPGLNQVRDESDTALTITQEPEEDSTPRASLEALSRLHEELKEQEAKAQEVAATERAQAKPPESMEAVPMEVVPAPVATDERVELDESVAPQTVELTANQVEAPEPSLKPRPATELLEIQIRIFPPAKPTLAGGEALPNQTDPLLPNLKSLPLRPKVALAPKQGAAATAVRTPVVPKPGSAKPAARPAQSKTASPTAKPGSSGVAKVPASPAKAVAAKPEVLKPEVAKPETAKAEAAKPVAATPAAPPPQPLEPTPVEKVVSEKAPIEKIEPEKAAAGKPPAEKTPTEKLPTAKPPAAAKVSNDASREMKIEDVPSFEMSQPANLSWLGSLKLKLGIGIVLMLIACVYFLGWGRGKSHPATSSNSAISSDGSGPSIIMGEGGWVEGWGGDPNGLHVGRQITIYRPSLKLSDYRLEFQASIDVRSIGWVFRAADPENYYAMKLMTVSNGLSPKVALFKYLIANGRQTQVGRVPIDLAVRPDTMVDIRVDVRGPQFTTFVQGQQVDSWTDDQLKVGGAGFLNEREERGKVKSVSIRYLSGAGK